MLIMGSKFASEMTKAGNDPEKRAKLVVAIQEASSGIIKNQSDDDDLPEDLFNAKDL